MFKQSFIFTSLLIGLSACSSHSNLKDSHKEESASYNWDSQSYISPRSPSATAMPTVLQTAINKFQARFGIHKNITAANLEESFASNEKACKLLEICENNPSETAKMREFLNILAGEQAKVGKDTSSILNLKFENKLRKELTLRGLADAL